MCIRDSVDEIRPHDSAYKHVSGYAEYTDDINEPKNTYFVAEFISKLRNISLDMVANQTRGNTLSLFSNMRQN